MFTDLTGQSAVGGVTVSHSLEVIRLNKVSESSSDEEIDVTDTDDASTGWTAGNGTDLADGRSNSDDSHALPVRENHAESHSSDNIPDPGMTPVDPESYVTSHVGVEDATTNPDEADEKSQAQNDEVAEIYAGQCVGDDTSIGSLVGIFSAPDAVSTFCGCSTPDTHSQSCYNSVSKNYSEIDPFLNQSTCRKTCGNCDDQSVLCSHSDWVNPSSPRRLIPEVDTEISCLPDKVKLIHEEPCHLGEQALSSGTEQDMGDTGEGESTPAKMHCDEASEAIAASEEVTYATVVELADPQAVAEDEDDEEHENGERSS